MYLSPYVIAIIAGWLVAQGVKYIILGLKERDLLDIRRIYVSGNMPSAHSATSVALLTVVGFRDGTASAIFGVALLAATIAMYDAMMVRRSVGEQGIAIQEIIKGLKSKVVIPRSSKGHTPLEVLCGALLGFIIGLVVHFATL